MKDKLHYFTMVNIQPFIIFQQKKRCSILFFLFAIFLFPDCRNHAHERTWSVYKADAESSSYSPLKEINKENVHQLKLAWIFNPEDAAEGSRFGGSQCNPIIIDGIMYVAFGASPHLCAQCK
jgi:quinoprotein glucose dehydrogenase